MKKLLISIIWLLYSGIFIFCAEILDAADAAYIGNIVLLAILLIYFLISKIFKKEYINKWDILVWLILTVISIPLIMLMFNLGIIGVKNCEYCIALDGLEYLFYVSTNLLFVLILSIINLMAHLIKSRE